MLLGLLVALIWHFSARTEALTVQYQIRQMAVSPTVFTAVSVPGNGATIAPFSPRNVLDLRRKSAIEVRVDLHGQMQTAQYQASESQPDDRGLMVRIALGLGLAYVVFLGCWIWTTRLRSRRPRH